MTRCPDTYRPSQHSGRARYRFAGRVMRCVLEEGHDGAHAYEIQPLPDQPESYQVKETYVLEPAKSRTPEQIAESDARYREHLRRKRGR